MKTKFILFTVLALSVAYALVIKTGSLVFAQSKEATFTFDPEIVQVAAGQTEDITIKIHNDDGIGAFNVVVGAENATIEKINNDLTVTGHKSPNNSNNAKASDYSLAVAQTNSKKDKAKISYTTNVDIASSATDLEFSIQVKRTGTEKGTISFLTGQGEQLVAEGQTTYTIKMVNTATLQDQGGGGDNTDPNGNLIFNPQTTNTDTSTLNTINAIIKEDNGIGAFDIIIDAQNATIESVSEELVSVKGGTATKDNYQKASIVYGNNKETVRITYTVTGIQDDANLAKEVAVGVQVKKTQPNTDGILTFNVSKTKLLGANRERYDPVAANQAVLTSGGGGEPTVAPTSSAGDCEPYWAIGDANCSGPQPDDKDYNLWADGFIPETGPADSTVCKEAGNIKQDFNKDGTVDLIDFEIWRTGKYGSKTNPDKQWPAECM